jgi:N-methylhydantoinase A
VYLEGRKRRLPLYRRDDLVMGDRFAGPALVTEYSSTSLIATAWTARVDAESNLRLEKDGG